MTGRALQYAFRRHFGTSPTGYLRRIRLERAHAALGHADPASNVTVALIARRWGWASHSQFTVAYRKRFGVPPATRCAAELKRHVLPPPGRAGTRACIDWR